MLQAERESHDKITTSGPPWVSMAEIEEASKDPRAHASVLGVWQRAVLFTGPDTWNFMYIQWERLEEFLAFQARQRKRYVGRFAEYIRRTERRLEPYSLHAPFRLEEDHTRQDKITTWIEYLAWETAGYNQNAQSQSPPR